jgi:hypothetical protein
VRRPPIPIKPEYHVLNVRAQIRRFCTLMDARRAMLSKDGLWKVLVWMLGTKNYRERMSAFSPNAATISGV